MSNNSKNDEQKIAALRKRANYARRKHEKCLTVMQVASQQHRERLAARSFDLKKNSDEADAALAAALANAPSDTS